MKSSKLKPEVVAYLAMIDNDGTNIECNNLRVTAERNPQPR